MKSLFGIKNIIKLTFKNEFVNNTNSIDLYELKEPNFPNDFEKRDNFFSCKNKSNQFMNFV